MASTSRLPIAAAGSIGLIVGVGVMNALTRGTADRIERPHAPPAASQISISAPTPPTTVDTSRLLELEARLAQLEAQQSASVPRASPPTTTSPADFEREQKRLVFERHHYEPVDPRWGPRTAASLTRDLEALSADGGAQHIEVDCRTT